MPESCQRQQVVPEVREVQTIREGPWSNRHHGPAFSEKRGRNCKERRIQIRAVHAQLFQYKSPIIAVLPQLLIRRIGDHDVISIAIWVPRRDITEVLLVEIEI